MFLYFLPNQTEATYRQSAAFQRLAVILRDGLDQIKTKPLNFGPAGKDTPGLLLYALPPDGSMPFPLRWEPTKQTWRQTSNPADVGAHWIGYYTANPPHPDALLRTKQITGYKYTLGDQREYNCPIVRRMQMIPMLPCGMKMEDGQFHRVVRPEWEDLWEASASWSKNMTDHERAIAAVRCLAVNYRVGPDEIDILGTFADESAISDIILAALDEQFFIDCYNDPKKKAWIDNVSTALESCLHGTEATCQDTSPVAAS